MSALNGIYKEPLLSFMISSVNSNSSWINAINAFLANPYNKNVQTWSNAIQALYPSYVDSAGNVTVLQSYLPSTTNSIIEALFVKFNPNFVWGTSTSCNPVSVILTTPDGTPVGYVLMGTSVVNGIPIISQKGPLSMLSFVSPSTTVSPFSGWNYNHNTRGAFQRLLSPDDSKFSFEVKYSGSVTNGIPENRIAERMGDSDEIAVGILALALFAY